MSETVEHDAWNYSIPKLPQASTIKLPRIQGVLSFDGVRNPSSRSATSHKIFMTYATEANDWQPKVGMGESSAEIAVALEALISPNVCDLRFQPFTVKYREGTSTHSYTHDLLITFRHGHRRVVFVRNESSLSKPRTTRQIKAIVAATPKQLADDMIVVNANAYTRQRRENLFRMHRFVFEPDQEADEVVLDIARHLKTLWYMHDLFPHAPISQARVFRACYRLVAQRQMHTNLDQVFWEHSKVTVAS